MDRKPIRSTSICSVAYEPATMTLELELRDGTVYQYFNVPEQVYQDFLAATFTGSYFNSYIKNCYSYRRVAD